MTEQTATQTFAEEIDRQIDDAIMIGGDRGRKIVTELADDLANRRIARICGDVDPADVELTDDQWERLTRNARKQAKFCSESW